MATYASEDLEYAVDELRLYALNTGELYEQRTRIEAMMRDPKLAEPLILSCWREWLADAKFRYAREIGTPEIPFTYGVIARCARELYTDTLEQIEIDRVAALELAARVRTDE